MDIDHPVTAFYFDRAVRTFCTRVENELETAKQGRGKSNSPARQRMRQAMILKKYLGIEQFASPGRR